MFVRVPSDETSELLRKVADREVRFFIVGKNGPSCFVLRPSRQSNKTVTVSLGSPNHCTCPIGRRTHYCAHIAFVLVRALGVPKENYLVWQKTLSSRQLDEVLSHRNRVMARQTEHASHREREASTGDLTASQGAVNQGCPEKPLEEGDSCPVCYENLTMADARQYCTCCGNSMHQHCVNLWLHHCAVSTKIPRCMFCREAWRPAKGSEATQPCRGTRRPVRLCTKCILTTGHEKMHRRWAFHTPKGSTRRMCLKKVLNLPCGHLVHCGCDQYFYDKSTGRDVCPECDIPLIPKWLRGSNLEVVRKPKPKPEGEREGERQGDMAHSPTQTPRGLRDSSPLSLGLDAGLLVVTNGVEREREHASEGGRPNTRVLGRSRSTSSLARSSSTSALRDGTAPHTLRRNESLMGLAVDHDHEMGRGREIERGTRTRGSVGSRGGATRSKPPRHGGSTRLPPLNRGRTVGGSTVQPGTAGFGNRRVPPGSLSASVGSVSSLPLTSVSMGSGLAALSGPLGGVGETSGTSRVSKASKASRGRIPSRHAPTGLDLSVTGTGLSLSGNIQR
ncbi:hypothetical protein KIPB_006215 [Kipferlia bialata]|uniref:Uncharacterized protein n=1 Tax=Kipferlia bialata TaxID=797122 RepID=A0A9K3GI18_9EUKA|nr:hypothetical protein KIPB_006215 [Kipferlia bialata]|eukprot:g6215.t1